MIAEHRHPNPQVDPRCPRLDRPPATNPPVFVWKPGEGHASFRLIVARDAALQDVVLDVANLTVPYYLPEKALPAGRYFWTWSVGGERAEILPFEIPAGAVVLEVPAAEGLFERLPRRHPRIQVRPDAIEALRASRRDARSALWPVLKACADRLLAEPHDLDEPPFLDDYHTRHDQWFYAFHKAMNESRRFLAGAEALALAHLASGRADYAQAASRRMLSVCRWDPAGSTWIEHNDEPHMSVVNWGPYVCDWVWDRFSDEERRRVVAHFRRRGQLAVKFIRSFGHYGSNHFGSHHGREVAFLGTVCLAFHEHIPEAVEWMTWLRPVLCGIWPVWAGEDGAWAEGPHYSTAYVAVMMRFAAALRTGTGVDLFRRPFWTGYLQWRLHCVPAGVEWVGFGDGSKYAGTDVFSAQLIRLIGHFTGCLDAERYWRALDTGTPAPDQLDLQYLFPLLYLENPRATAAPPAAPAEPALLHVFPAAGWAAIHTRVHDPAADVALTFRSSPFGSVSHSHADNNDFALHVAGKSLLVPSGLYDGWATNHHAHWVWHTKSANCLTLSDAGQIMRSPDSTGAVEDAYEDDRLAYFRGNADASYQDRARRCRRHVLFLKPHTCFVLVDELEVIPGRPSSMQWNGHGWAPFAMTGDNLGFRLERGGSILEGHFLWHAQSFVTLSDPMDPPPLSDGFDRVRWPEYHLRFTPWGLVEKRRNLGVVLCPGHGGLRPAAVTAARQDSLETADIGGDRLTVLPDGPGPVPGFADPAVAVVHLLGRTYAIGDGPIRHARGD
jgi:hypothetical protein